MSTEKLKNDISVCILFFLDEFDSLYLLLQLKVYLRTHALDQMVQAVTASAGIRMIKRVEQTLQDLGVCFLDISLYSTCTNTICLIYIIGLFADFRYKLMLTYIYAATITIL